MMITSLYYNGALGKLSMDIGVYDITSMFKLQDVKTDIVLGSTVFYISNSSTEMVQLTGTATSPLEYVTYLDLRDSLGARYERFMIFDNAGTFIYSDNQYLATSNWVSTPRRSTGMAVADVDNDGYNEVCYLMSANSHVKCVRGTGTLIRDWLLTPYLNVTKAYHIPLAIGDVYQGLNANGKEIITPFGIYNNTGYLLYSLPFNASMIETIQLVDANNNYADEIYFSKKTTGVEEYSSTQFIPSTTSSTTTTTILEISDTTPFTCNFNSDTNYLPPQSCVHERKILGCTNSTVCNTGIDDSRYNSSPKSLALRTGLGDDIQVYNNTIGNETSFLRIEFKAIKPFTNSLASSMYVQTYVTNYNTTILPVDTFYINNNGQVVDSGYGLLCRFNWTTGWHNIKYELNLVSQQSKIYIDFVDCGSWHNFENGWNRVMSFSIGSMDGFDYNIDDLRVQQSALSPPITTTTISITTTSILFNSCGNGICESSETYSSCSQDCTIITCGDGVCDNRETPVSCPIDCSSDGINFLLSPTDSGKGLLPETAMGLAEYLKGALKLWWILLIVVVIMVIILFTVGVSNMLRKMGR